jgi:polyhydroxyalkanoate synthesis regulator phasin
MAERADQSGKSLRDLAEETFLAGVGAVVLTKERIEELVDELADKGKLTREDARELVDGMVGRWRGDAVRLGERASSTLGGVFREIGLVTRREYEELELRQAQLEHRLRLVERQPGPQGIPAARPQSGSPPPRP